MDITTTPLRELFDYVQQPDTPVEHLIKLSTHESVRLRELILENPNTPTSVVDKFTLVDSENLATTAFLDPRISNFALRNLRNVRTNIAYHVSFKNSNLLTPQHIEELINHYDQKVRRTLVQENTLTAENIRTLVEKEKFTLVLEAVCEKPETPTDVLVNLSAHRNILVRQKVASNPNTPLDVLKKLFTTKNDEVKCAVLRNKNLPTEYVQHIIPALKTLNTLFYASLIKNLEDEDYITILETSKKLARKWETNVADTVAKNHTVSVNVLKYLMDKKFGTNVLNEISSHPNATNEMLEEIFKIGTGMYTDRTILSGLASNRSASEELLQKVYNIKETGTHYNLAQNPATPLPILYELMETKQSDVFNETVHRIIEKDPKFVGWPDEWIEEHFNITIVHQRTRKMFVRKH